MKQLFNIILLLFSPITAIILFIVNIDKLLSKLFLKLFIYGIFLTVPVIFFEQILISFIFFPELFTKLYISFIVSFIEEFLKRFIILSVANKNIFYKYKLSGILFALFVALGFSTLENALYIFFKYQSYQLNYPRPLISSIGHIIFAIIMGYFISLSKAAISKRKNKYFFIMSLLVPVILHGIFDFIIYAESLIILPLYMLIIFFLYFIYHRKLTSYYEIKRRKKN